MSPQVYLVCESTSLLGVSPQVYLVCEVTSLLGVSPQVYLVCESTSLIGVRVHKSTWCESTSLLGVSPQVYLVYKLVYKSHKCCPMYGGLNVSKWLPHAWWDDCKQMAAPCMVG